MDIYVCIYVCMYIYTYISRSLASRTNRAPWAETLVEHQGALALLRVTLQREADVLRRIYLPLSVKPVKSGCLEPSGVAIRPSF